MRLLPLIILMLLTIKATATNAEFHLTVAENTLPGLPIYIAIYPADAGDWEVEPVHVIKHTLPEASEFSIPLAISPGRYAIRAFVDQDDDGLLTTNDKDRPKEPFANSIGDSRSRPSHHFKHSIITLSEEAPQTALTLRYPRGSRDQ